MSEKFLLQKKKLLLFLVVYCFPWLCTVCTELHSAFIDYFWAQYCRISVGKEVESSNFLSSLSHSLRNDGAQIGTFLGISFFLLSCSQYFVWNNLTLVSFCFMHTAELFCAERMCHPVRKQNLRPRKRFALLCVI